MIGVIIGSIVLAVGGIIAIIFWYKKINPDTTWIYAIYVINIILMGIVLLVSRIFT